MPDETKAPDLLDTLNPSDEAAAAAVQTSEPAADQPAEGDAAPAAELPLESASSDLDLPKSEAPADAADKDQGTEQASSTEPVAPAADPVDSPSGPAPDAPADAPAADAVAEPAADQPPADAVAEPAAADAPAQADEAPADEPAKEEDKSADPVIPDGVVPSTDSELPALSTDDISPKAPVAAPVVDDSNANPAIPQAPSEPEADKAAAAGAGDIGATPEPASDEPADEAAPAEAKADEPVIAQVPAEDATIFDGRSGPSPAPDLGDQEALPHPALSGQADGGIPGTTEATAVFFPPVGDTDPGLSSEPVISVQAPDAPDIKDPGEQAEGEAAESAPSEGASVAEDAAPAEQEESTPVADSADPAPVADETPAATAPAAAPSAVPTAAHAPDAFGELNADGDAALDDIDESEAEVLRLELKGLANLALALVKRIELISQKKAVGEHIESIQTSAQQVVSGALNIFETDEGDLGGYEVADAGTILSDCGFGEGDVAE